MVEEVLAFKFLSALAERILPTSFRSELPMAFPTVFFLGGTVCTARGIVGVDDGELKLSRRVGLKSALHHRGRRNLRVVR